MTTSKRKPGQPFLPGELADFFGVNPKTVARWCDDGDLIHFKTPRGHRRIPVEAANAFADKHHIKRPE